MDGILGFHVAFFTNSFFFDNRILAIRKPLTRIFLFRWNLGYHEALFTNCSFSRWNLGYHEALFTNSFSFTMEFWLSRSLFHELFLFHDGILAIKEPFSRTFSLSRWNSSYQGAFHTISRWNSGYQGAFHTNFFSFIMELWLSRSLSHELFLFHDGILRIRVFGEDSFHITKSIYIGSASLKTLPFDLEPPL
jgi:hypothetical protein